MERGFKYRIYPNACQREQIARTLGCCRFVYNRALDVKKSAYAKTGKTVSWTELSRMLPVWKRDPETSWLAQADSMALQLIRFNSASIHHRASPERQEVPFTLFACLKLSPITVKSPISLFFFVRFYHLSSKKGHP